jgi:two-component system, cell cycle response regulator
VRDCAAAPHDAPGADLAPLGRRLLLLQVLRFLLVSLTLGIPALLPGPSGADAVSALAGLGAVYAVVTGGTELVRRRVRPHGPLVLGGLVLFDGVYLASVLALTGGPGSVLAFLVLVHVVAVTLLLSFRTGLKAALWHALLLFAMSWLQGAGVVDEGPGTSAEQAAVIVTVALLLLAVASAWFSSLNEGQLRRGKTEARILAGMAGCMAALRHPTELVHALLAAVADAFVGRRTALVLHDDGGGTARAFVLAVGGTLEQVACGPAPGGEAPVDATPTLARRLVGENHALLAVALPGADNVVVVPLVAEGRTLGSLAVEWGGGRGTRVSAGTVTLLGQLAAHAALALRTAALQAEVERLARTDALTGLPNRRVFQETLARELAVAARRGTSCGLVVLDVDHFKAVNDTHGHQAGDEVLRRIGAVLAEACRGTDVAARYGGEEFAVVVPDCTPPEALAVAERVRAAVAASPGTFPVTMSAGVATYPADAGDAAGLVAAADAALYRAKRQGRDRSVRFRRLRTRPERPRSRALLRVVSS